MTNNLPECDHLILLVGGNPLPNAVAGKLLLKPGGIITLLHSGNTATTAQKLRAWLINHTQGQVQFRQIDEASPTSITDGVNTQLKSVHADTAGLHYTGGTKTMSVHAYRAIEQWAKDKKPPIYSYLDARTLSLIIDSEPHPIPLAGIIALSLDDLLALHGWNVKNQPTTEPILPKFAQVLLKLCSTNNLTAWDEWKEQELRAKCCKENGNWLSKTELNQISLIWPTATELADLVQVLQVELEQGAAGLHIESAAKAAGFKKPEDLCKQLVGGYWLESCVLEALKSIAGTHRLHDVYMNIVVPTIGDKDFELDVVAIRDYQLYGFSCCTDSEMVRGGRERLKLKLFEATIRAQQLGGDEARVALVCSADDPDGLQAEMRRDLAPHIRVFGRRHLAKLATEFARWLQPE
ncbi:MAG: DUF1887 family protein [Anaerolineae bacterium]|nr:DUF1887 family protein [Anaerolineae bacterium]